jgi:hypothetical protein
LKEANKEALQRKKDKLDDAKAKAIARANIEADKKARAAKAAREKALRDGTAIPADPDSASSSSAPKPAPVAATGEKKAYDQTRLQIRLPGGGQPLVHAVPSSATLGDVSEWVKGQTAMETIVFSSAFPR